MAMNHNESEAFVLMHKALGRALDEINNPGAARNTGLDIRGHIEAVRALAKRVVPEATVYGSTKPIDQF